MLIAANLVSAADSLPPDPPAFKGKIGVTGEDVGSPVSPAYVPPFRFTGGLDQVTLELR